MSGARVLPCNTDPKRVFNGQFPRHRGFVITPGEAMDVIKRERSNRRVVHPFLIGRVMLTKGEPDRWVIDFQKMNILQAQA